MFSDVLRNKRKDAGWSQQKLAEKAGLSLRTVCYLESRGTNPTFETVCALAEAFGCATDELRPGNFCNEEKICGRKKKTFGKKLHENILTLRCILRVQRLCYRLSH